MKQPLMCLGALFLAHNPPASHTTLILPPQSWLWTGGTFKVLTTPSHFFFFFTKQRITCLWLGTASLSLATGVWQPILRLLLGPGRDSPTRSGVWEKSLALGQDRPGPCLPLPSQQSCLPTNSYPGWAQFSWLRSRNTGHMVCRDILIIK